MREHNNTPQLGYSDFDAALKDTRGLSCKPSNAKKSEDWFIDSRKSQISSTVTTQNGYSSAELELSQESILQAKTEEEVSIQFFCEEELKVAVEMQRKTLVETFENEMSRKMDEVEGKICRRWEEAILKMHSKYEEKIKKHGETLKEIQEKKEENLQKQKEQLEQEINHKYNRDYLEKLDTLTQNLQKIEENKFIDIINEVKSELETDCNEKHQLKLAAYQDQIKQELANLKTETEEPQRVLETEYLANIEKDIQSAYEIEITDIMVRNQRDIEFLKDGIKDLQEEDAYENMKAELKEKLALEYIVREDHMNKEWKEKLEAFKKEMNESIAQQRTKRLTQEYLEIAIEKKGMESAANDNTKVKKVEEVNKELQAKLLEQEKIYTQTVLDLKRELESLKPARGYSERLSARNTSADREAKNPKYQLDRPRSTDKMRKSCGESSLAEMLLIDAKAGEESAKKTETWRPKKNPLFNEARRGSQEPSTSRNKSPEVKRSLSKTLSKANLPPKQMSMSLTKPFNFERATKAILQMLSPSSPSELRYGQLDTKQEPTQEQEENTVTVREEEVKEAKEIKSDNVPKIVCHQRRNSGMMTERGRGVNGTSREVKALVQKDVNANVRKGSVTDRKLETREEDKALTLKQKEFLQRQSSVTRRREGSVTQRKENYGSSDRKEVSNKVEDTGRKSVNSGKSGCLTERKSVTMENAYEKMFEIRSNDDDETKAMKTLKISLEEATRENDLLESKCSAKEVDLCVNFPLKISSLSNEQRKNLQNKLQSLFKLWKTAEVSYIARIAFMESLEKLLRYDDITMKLSVETSQMAQLTKDMEDLLKLLQWRNQLKGQISTENFSYSLYAKVYSAIEDNNKDLKRALECYQNKHGKRVQYRGVDLGEAIKVDAWECEYLRKNNKAGAVQRRK